MEAILSPLDSMNLAAGARLPVAISLAVLVLVHRVWRQFNRRTHTLPRNKERILIVGASSGIGHALALEYATAGSRVCIVGRRERELTKVADECEARIPPSTPPAAAAHEGHDQPSGAGEVLAILGDCTREADMLSVREKLEQRWGGVDTLIVCAGVSALRPLLEVAGLERRDGRLYPAQVDAEGVQRTVAAATAAVQGNYIGPLVCAVVFIPFLSATCKAPSIVLMSSWAAVCPAPTRTLYTSTKASSLLLYQSLAIEHPSITFTYMLPGTVEGDFRASAVDGGSVREADPNKHGLKRIAVARRTIAAIDAREKFVFMPALYGRTVHFAYWLVPKLVEKLAARKYNFA